MLAAAQVPGHLRGKLEGGNLAARLKGSPPSDMEAAQLVELLARAVHYAHSRSIVHRDLKPANILLTSDGVPKIADFGLAKILSEDQGVMHTGAILGTPSYVAPEQGAGKGREIGPTSDVYALGAILYELLTGRPPFRGATILETLRWVGFFLTVWAYQRIGAPIAGLPPILVLEAAVATGCMAALLGGSFYVMTAACLATAVLESLWPEVGRLISGVFCSPALFWVGWKYSRRLPLH
jgi:hypothetical protein